MAGYLEYSYHFEQVVRSEEEKAISKAKTQARKVKKKAYTLGKDGEQGVPHPAEWGHHSQNQSEDSSSSACRPVSPRFGAAFRLLSSSIQRVFGEDRKGRTFFFALP